MVLITDPRERGKKQNLPARNAENTWQMRTTEATYLSFLVNGFKPHGSNWLMPSRECRRVKALSTVHVNKTLKQLRRWSPLRQAIDPSWTGTTALAGMQVVNMEVGKLLEALPQTKSHAPEPGLDSVFLL